MIHQRETIFVLTLLVFSLLIAPSKAKEKSETCPQTPEKTAIVKSISKQNTIRLADETELTLANIYLNKKNAHQFLKNNFLNKEIYYFSSGRLKDKYDRFIVQLFYKEDNKLKWLQETLVKKGLGVAMALPTNWQCMHELLEIENLTRVATKKDHAINLGFPIVKADNIKKLNKKPQGSFQIVKGQVQSIHRTAQNTYINFSHNWRKDFSIVVSNHLLKQKKRPWPKLKTLKGKTIIVRGWLDHYNGPIIRVETREMIEIKK